MNAYDLETPVTTVPLLYVKPSAIDGLDGSFLHPFHKGIHLQLIHRMLIGICSWMMMASICVPPLIRSLKLSFLQKWINQSGIMMQVDTSVNRVQDCLPSSLKRASFKAYKHARSAPVAARSVMIDVKNTGMVETASGLAKTVFSKYEPVAKDFYTKYEPVTEEYLLYVWRVLNQYLLFQRAAQAAAPIAGYCSDMYNQKVELAAKSGYKVASHLPLIPIERIAEALRNENMQPMVVDGGHGEEVAA